MSIVNGFSDPAADIIAKLAFSNAVRTAVSRFFFVRLVVLEGFTVSQHTDSEFGTAISGLIGVVLLIAVIYFLTVARFQSGSDVGTSEQIAARLAPVGVVNTDAAAVAAVPAAAAAGAETSAADEGPGVATYTKACMACHATGVAGAPKLGDKAAWEPRLAQGLDGLLNTAVNGKGAMPPRGTCMDCSDDELMAVIEYMVSKVQ